MLQVLPDTDATAANLDALRFHANLARHGDEIRTLAIRPGNSRHVSSLVPAMAPSARSLAATTQLRREMRWPDVVCFVDCLPRWVGGDRTPPIIVRLTEHATDATLERIMGARPSAVAAVAVSGSASRDRLMGLGLPATAIHVVRTPMDHHLVSAEHTTGQRDAACAAARSELGVRDGEIVVVGVDTDTGAIVNATDPSATDRSATDRSATDPSATGRSATERHSRRNRRAGGKNSSDRLDSLVATANQAHGAPGYHNQLVAPHGAEEILLCAATLAVVLGETSCAPAILVDLMANGVVPIASQVHRDGELIVDDLTAILVDGGRPDDRDRQDETRTDGRISGSGRNEESIAPLAQGLAEAATSPERLAHLSLSAADTVLSLCHPDEVHRQWSDCLAEALPSLT